MCITVANKLVICAKRDRICINMTDQIVVFAVFYLFLPIYLKYGKNLGEILCVIGTIGSLLGRPIHISDCRSTDLILFHI